MCSTLPKAGWNQTSRAEGLRIMVPSAEYSRDRKALTYFKIYPLVQIQSFSRWASIYAQSSSITFQFFAPSNS